LGDRDALRTVITDRKVFAELAEELAIGKYDMLRYWRAVGDSPAEIEAAYMRSIDAQLKVGRALPQTVQGDGREATKRIDSSLVFFCIPFVPCGSWRLGIVEPCSISP
jgi:hypothetical protein